jgi:hypothetical protein
MMVIAKEVSVTYDQLNSMSFVNRKKTLNDVAAKNESLKIAFEREFMQQSMKR